MSPPQLVKANSRRQKNASREQCLKARQAVRVLKTRRNGYHTAFGQRVYYRHLTVLQARIDQPQASLAEIAASLGETKNAYWRALNRAFDYASRLI